MVAFHLVPKKQKHPPAEEKYRAPNPLEEQKKNDARKNHGDADGMQQLVPSGFVLVIVLCHVVRQAWHAAHLPAAPCGLPSRGAGSSAFNVDFIPNLADFLERSGSTGSPCAVVLPEWALGNVQKQGCLVAAVSVISLPLLGRALVAFQQAYLMDWKRA